MRSVLFVVLKAIETQVVVCSNTIDGNFSQMADRRALRNIFENLSVFLKNHADLTPGKPALTFDFTKKIWSLYLMEG